jgi:N4-(beta-N-acetylglucosaminyl)-L-asparaginase
MGFVSRRSFVQSAGMAALIPGSALAGAPSTPSNPSNGPVISVSSANGMETTRLACQMIRDGSSPLDSVVAGVALVEANPKDTSVGFGGLPNERGVVELDAAVMDGATHRAGAVASIRNIMHPAQVARLVAQRTDHVLLVGEGALEFARAHGFPEKDLLTDRARRIWLKWKENLSQDDDWLAPAAEEEDDVAAFFRRNSQPVDEASQSGVSLAASHRAGQRFRRPTGTIHCSALTSGGDIACTTTTSGLAFKIPGRVGDSPIIGAGLYCDNTVGSCGSTGRGEANLQNMCSFAAVELMRQGASPLDAGMEVLRRVVKTTEPRLLNADGQPDFGLSFYLLAKDGRYAGVSMWGPAKFSVTDESGTRLESCTTLYTRA